MRTLSGCGLVLEPQRVQHADEMFRVLSDPAIYRYLDDRAPASVEALADRYRRLETRRSADGAQVWLNWVICSRSEGPMGYVQATVFQDRSASIAFVIGSRWWGKGFGRTATSLMLVELADYYGVRDAYATASAENARSISLLRALGFSERDPDSYPHGPVSTGDVLMVRREHS